MSSKVFNLREDFQPLAAAPSQAPVIQGVKLLGHVSRNGRIYPDSVMETAVTKYADCPVNLDHPRPGQEMREFGERFGWIENPRHIPGKGIFGDLRFNPEHKLARQFSWWAKQKPNKIGLSHNATARIERNREGKDEVAEILEVESVDLVADPATTRGLLESLTTLQESEMDDGFETKGKDGECAHVQEEGDGLDSLPPVEDKPATSDWAQHLGQLILGILQDGGLDKAGKKAKISQALNLLDEEAPADEPNAMDDESEVEEADDAGSASDEEAGEASEDSDEEMAKKAEEALRKTNSPHYLALLKKLDGYRVAESRRVVLTEAKAAAAKASIPEFAVTETFLSTLATTPRGDWEKVLEDRRKVSLKFNDPKSSTPTGDDPVAALRKKLRGEI